MNAPTFNSSLLDGVRGYCRDSFSRLRSEGYTPEALHTYTDQEGKPLFWVSRLRNRATGEKQMRPISYNGASFAQKLPAFPAGRPLYRLDLLHEWRQNNNTAVLLVEGENCADLLNALNKKEGGGLHCSFIAMSFHGGAQSVERSDYSPLASSTGRAIFLWPDHDEPGREAMEKAASLLPGCYLHMVEPARLGLPQKGDAVEFILSKLQAVGKDVDKYSLTPAYIARLTEKEREALALAVVNALPDEDYAQGGESEATTAQGQENQPIEAQENAPRPRVEMLCAADIPPEPIDWIWPGWLAAGKFHILAGSPGCGKTTLSMGLSSIITNGGEWPDGTRCTPGNVVIWSGEDDPKDTLIPRLMATGADLRRVFICGQIRHGTDGEPVPFDPASDMPILARAMAEMGNVRLLIIDSVASAVGGDSHKNTEVRRGLQPVLDLAQATGCAVLGITHFAKGTKGASPTERINGSIGFAALARVVIVASKDAEGGTRTMARTKSNIGSDEGGFSYTLEQVDIGEVPGLQASRVWWGASLEGPALELLDKSEGNVSTRADGGALMEAMDWLRDQLKGGELPKAEVEAYAKEEGFSPKTLRTARERLKLSTPRKKITGSNKCTTYWALPQEPIWCETAKEWDE